VPFVHAGLSFALSPSPILDSLARPTYGHPCTRGTKRTLRVFVSCLLCTLVCRLPHHPYLTLALSCTCPTVWPPAHKRHELFGCSFCASIVPAASASASCHNPAFCCAIGAIAANTQIPQHPPSPPPSRAPLDTRDPHNEHPRCSLWGLVHMLPLPHARQCRRHQLPRRAPCATRRLYCHPVPL
jgi:hypothetical protein